MTAMAHKLARLLYQTLKSGVLPAKVSAAEYAAFQSTAGPKTGCNAMALKAWRSQHMFQSTAGPKTGCNHHHLCIFTHAHMFQSTAGPKTGCNRSSYRD